MKYKLIVYHNGKIEEKPEQTEHWVEGDFYHLCEMICALCTRWDGYKIYPWDDEACEDWVKRGGEL